MAGVTLDYLSGFGAPDAYKITAALGITDPRYLGVLRTLQQQMDATYSDARNRAAQTQARYLIGSSDINRQGERNRQSINASMEDRGILNSSETNDRLGRQQEDQNRQQSGLEFDTANTISDLERSLANAYGGFQRTSAESGADYATRQYQQDMLAKSQADFLHSLYQQPVTSTPAVPAPGVPPPPVVATAANTRQNRRDEAPPRPGRGAIPKVTAI